MISEVDEKTYELGMIRALGFRRSHIFILLLLQSFYYALPGTMLGFLFA